MRKFDDFLEEQLQDEEFRREYESMQSEFDIIRAMVDARISQNLTQKELVERTDMTLQMNYQEKYEQGIEQGNKQSALRMIEDGDLPLEKIALYSDLTLEQVRELEKGLQPI